MRPVGPLRLQLSLRHSEEVFGNCNLTLALSFQLRAVTCPCLWCLHPGLTIESLYLGFVSFLFLSLSSSFCI